MITAKNEVFIGLHHKNCSLVGGIKNLLGLNIVCIGLSLPLPTPTTHQKHFPLLFTKPTFKHANCPSLLCKNCYPPEKDHHPLSQQPLVYELRSFQAPFFENLVGG